MNPYLNELMGLLAKNFINYGLSQKEFMVLNTYLISTDRGHVNYPLIKSMTNIPEEEIVAIVEGLHDREKIIYDRDDNVIDVNALQRRLYSVELEFKSLVQRIKESRDMASMYGEYDHDHFGMVELYPEEKGISIRTRSEGFVWSKKRIIELAEELLNFADSVEQVNIDEFNLDLKKKKDFQREQEKKRNLERQEEKQRAAIPQPGYIVIFRLSNGNYKFSYTVKSSLQAKKEILKDQYGDTIQFVHHIETHDTMKFYHQFLKKQFSNRNIDGKNSEYALRDEDVEYLREEKFPSNAMEWAFGSVTHG